MLDHQHCVALVAQLLQQTRQSADVAGVQAIIGAGASGVTIEAFNRVAKAGRVLMVSPSATSPAISNLTDEGLLWRTAPSDAVQGRAIAEYIARRGYEKVAIVNRNDAYGNGLSAAISGQLCAADASFCGGSAILSRLYSDQTGPLQDDEARVLSELVDTFKPEVVVLIAYVQDGVAFMNLAAGKGLRFILTDGTRDIALLGTTPNQRGVSDASILCTLVGTNPASPSG
ncbi:MAG TPA: ABC transporter substrate-binding protein, partial [Anaerolineales bacterium]|nr:ABC transporter substrate-binding protein [Anaerolineales bacterium]